MNTKKYSFILIIILTVTLLTGCNNNETSSNSSLASQGTLYCERAGTIENGSVNFSYILHYKDDNIIELHSTEEVISEDSETLDIYENAYRSIFKAYEGLKHYDNTITRTNTSIKSYTVINYEKINIDDLLAIEGEEDNVIEDGKAKLSIWLDFAEQFGTTCE